MNVDATTLTAVASTLLAIGSTAVAYLKRRDDSVGRRIDAVMDGNQALVNDLQSERAALIERVDTLLQRVQTLEIDRDGLHTQVGHLRDMVSDQAREVTSLRISETELRVWAGEIITPWIVRATSLIRELGGDIAPPPPPPARRD